MNTKLLLVGAALSALAIAAGPASAAPNEPAAATKTKKADKKAKGGKPAKGAKPAEKGAAKADPKTASAKGECHGINACKGKGECGGVGHGCAGSNTCKGQGWVTLAKADCEAKGGTFKTGGHSH